MFVPARYTGDQNPAEYIKDETYNRAYKLGRENVTAGPSTSLSDATKFYWYMGYMDGLGDGVNEIHLDIYFKHLWIRKVMGLDED